MELSEILSRCDHTLLRTDAGSAEIRQLCDEADEVRLRQRLHPALPRHRARRYVGGQRAHLHSHRLPQRLHAPPPPSAFEAADAVDNGADEVDMVINLAMVKDGDWDDRRRGSSPPCAAPPRASILKVIIECCLLTDEREAPASAAIVSDSGADFIKTSTGFSTGGATREDVALLRASTWTPDVKVKAAGGITDPAGRGGLHQPRRGPPGHQPHRQARHRP